MSKMVEIENCVECKNWDHAGDRCCLVHRTLQGAEHNEIPPWCPLPDMIPTDVTNWKTPESWEELRAADRDNTPIELCGERVFGKDGQWHDLNDDPVPLDDMSRVLRNWRYEAKVVHLTG